MHKQHYTTCDLKRLGVHYKTIRAIQRLQRNQIYADKRFEELKIKLTHLIGQLNPTLDSNVQSKIDI